MRILLITGSIPPMKCGVGDYTACLSDALGHCKDITVAILTSREAGLSRRDTGNVEVFPLVQQWRISELPRIVNFIRRWKPDIAHFQFPTQGYRGGGWLPLLLPSILFFLNIIIVQTWHEYYTKDNINLGLWPNMLLPGGLVAVRPAYQAHMPPLYQRFIRHKSFRFIPNSSTLPRLILNREERSAVRTLFASNDKPLLVYFGFIYPNKGVETIFNVADPLKHHVILIGDLNNRDTYHQSLIDLMQRAPWKGNVTATGYLSAIDAAKILSVADAVVLPFLYGGGLWNTSLHGTAIQGTFIITTSHERHGYDLSENIYYAHPGDVQDMRQAINAYAGIKNTEANISRLASWKFIAEEHVLLYRRLLS